MGFTGDVAQLQAELDSAQAQIVHLTTALASSRRIGAAVGIVMSRRRIGYDEAFEALVSLSQTSHRKLRDVADEILYTGAIDGPDLR